MTNNAEVTDLKDNWVVTTPEENVNHTCKPNEKKVMANLLKEQSKHLLKQETLQMKRKRKMRKKIYLKGLKIIKEIDNVVGFKTSVKANQTETEDEKEVPIWIGKNCGSCKFGFNRSSEVVTCCGCGNFAHTRAKCLSTSRDTMGMILCKACSPNVEVQTNRQDDSQDFTKLDKKFQCNTCGIIFKYKFSIKRHISRLHEVKTETLQNVFEIKTENHMELDETSSKVSVEDQETPKGDKDETIKDMKSSDSESTTEAENEDTNDSESTVKLLLTRLNLSHIYPVFEQEGIDMEALCLIDAFELRELGVKFGPAKKIIHEVQKKKI